MSSRDKYWVTRPISHVSENMALANQDVKFYSAIRQLQLVSCEVKNGQSEAQSLPLIASVSDEVLRG